MLPECIFIRFVVPQNSEQEAERKQTEAVQLEQRMKEMEKAMLELEHRYDFCACVLCVLRGSVN